MAKPSIKRVLISVYEKTGIVDFARSLVDEFGVEVISTGGTAALLKENDIPVTLVEEVTGSPEMMDGRVKTLHPKIHAAILADRDNPDHMRQLAEQGIEPIDMVVVNLYPFEMTVADPNCKFQQAVEMIDIGGPCLLRAAAKNHRHVLPIGDPGLLEDCLAYLRAGDETEDATLRCRLASIAFDITSEYDIEIQTYLERIADQADDIVTPEPGEPPVADDEDYGFIQVWASSKELRYGENPHQKGAYVSAEESPGGCVAPENLIAGEPVSFNNYADANAASELTKELTRELAPGPAAAEQEPTEITALAPEHPRVVVFVKHTNACGVGVAHDPREAYRLGYLGDPNAAMGGVLACNFQITPDVATAVMETYDRWGKTAGAGGFFVEVWVAPGFDEAAVEIIQSTKNWGRRVRLMAVGPDLTPPDEDTHDSKSVIGGMLTQTPDVIGLDEDRWKIVTKRSPTESEMADLRLAWLVGKHTKSNAITICKDRMLIGNGAGQMSRVMSCRIATWLAKENGHADKLAGAAAASDAFFPFRDGPDLLMDAGVTAIIQPGGSKRDEDTIKACDEHGVAMIFTGTRHFRH